MIVATAGHIDHGKTRLVKALTGIDTDRLPEERSRGISIDLGFAHSSVGEQETVSFIDVPGHERFIRNMLAGVCGIDAALLVVAADDGIMPQTAEHLSILDLLDVRRGAVVITKTDLVTPQRVEGVQSSVQAALAETSLAGARAFPVSTVTGEGSRLCGSEYARLRVTRRRLLKMVATSGWQWTVHSPWQAAALWSRALSTAVASQPVTSWLFRHPA